MTMLGIILYIVLKIMTKEWYKEIPIIVLIGYSFSTIVDILNYIIFKKSKDTRFIYAHKNIIPVISPIKASIIKGLLEIAFLPHIMYIELSSIIKTLYRMKVSKKHLLEWLTSEEAENQTKTNLISYYTFMCINPIFGSLLVLLCIILKNIFLVLLGILWIISPIIAWKISTEKKCNKTNKKN